MCRYSISSSRGLFNLFDCCYITFFLYHVFCFFFLSAYLLKNDENKAMSPAKLQDELNNILKFNAATLLKTVSWQSFLCTKTED